MSDRLRELARRIGAAAKAGRTEALDALLRELRAAAEAEAAAAEAAAPAATESVAAATATAAPSRLPAADRAAAALNAGWRRPGGATPLMLACRGGHAGAARLLLAAGADPSLAAGRSRRTALHRAALAGSAGCAAALLAACARGGAAWRAVDAPAASGFAALHYAALFGYARVARALLEGGASPLLATRPRARGAARYAPRAAPRSTPLVSVCGGLWVASLLSSVNRRILPAHITSTAPAACKAHSRAPRNKTLGTQHLAAMRGHTRVAALILLHVARSQTDAPALEAAAAALIAAARAGGGGAAAAGGGSAAASDAGGGGSGSGGFAHRGTSWVGRRSSADVAGAPAPATVQPPPPPVPRLPWEGDRRLDPRLVRDAFVQTPWDAAEAAGGSGRGRGRSSAGARRLRALLDPSEPLLPALAAALTPARRGGGGGAVDAAAAEALAAALAPAGVAPLREIAARALRDHLAALVAEFARQQQQQQQHQVGETPSSAFGCGADDLGAGGDCDDAGCCGVCLDEPPAVALAPCRHALCAACAGRVVGGAKGAALCPFCRRPIGGLSEVAAPPPAPACGATCAGVVCA